MSVIQVRGTSGSGKTWVMRQIIKRLGTLTPHFIPRRRKPLYYTRRNGIVVLGNYDNPHCGGCDNVAKEPIVAYIGADGVEAVYKIIKSLKFKYLLCEGLLLSEDTRHALTARDLRCVFLTTPIEQCIKGVEKRRLAKGNTEPLTTEKELSPKGKKKPTAAHRLYLRSRTIERARIKLIDAGVHCIRQSSEQAVETITKWLKQ